MHIPPLARTLGRTALDFLLPPHCACCDSAVAEPAQLCATCFYAMAFITEPACLGCGLPFASYALAGRNRICERCVIAPPAWHHARAALLYDTQAKKLILPLKHADRTETAVVLALHMHRAGAALLAQADILVPVPLHRWRLLHRRFNQAAILAHALGRRTRLPVSADALQRIHPTATLGGLSAADRGTTLRGTIAIREKRRLRIAGRRVVLIDDVMTSGATATACAHALLDAGAANVDVLVASRVADPRQDRLSPSTREQDFDDAEY